MVAVTGSTGQLGRLVIGALKEKVAASDIVALARTPARAADLGVAVREADYDKPETLERALSNVDTLLLISSSEVGKRAGHHGNLIAAAKRNGVKRIVYTSLLPYKNLSEAEYVAVLESAGLPEGLARAIAGWDVAASRDALFDDSRQLSALIGQPTTPLSATVGMALKQIT